MAIERDPFYLAPSKPVKKPKAKPKAKPKPSRPIGRPAPLVALHERYGLVYDPEAEASPIVKAELEALNELYKSRTGRDIGDEVDVRAALERAELLRVPRAVARAPKSAQELRNRRREQGELFASALDALDALGETGFVQGFKEPFYEAPVVEAGREKLDEGIDAANRVAGKAIGPSVVAAAAALQPISLLATTETGRNILGAVQRRVAASPGIPSVDVGVGINPFDASQSRIGVDVKGGTVGENVRTLGRGVAAGLEKVGEGAEFVGGKIGDLPAPKLYGTGLVGTEMQGYTPRLPFTGTRPAPRDRLRGSRATVSDVLSAVEKYATNPDSVISASSSQDTNIVDADPIINDLSARVKTGEIDAPVINQILDDYINSLELQGAAEQKAASPYTKSIDDAMKAFAIEEGWPAQDWDNLTVGEKIFRANTKNQYLRILGRNLVRAYGETAAVPAAFKAIFDAGVKSLRGDPKEAETILRGVFGPYVQFSDTAGSQGFYRALHNFIRDNPVDAFLIANQSLRIGSRAGGAISRATGSQLAQPGQRIYARGPEVISEPQPRPLPEVPEARPGQAAARERLAAQREADRIAAEDEARAAAFRNARTEEERRAAADIRVPTVYVGTTTGRLFNDAMLRAFSSKIVERNNRFGKYVRGKIEGREASRITRWNANVQQGLTLEIQAILERALSEREGRRIRRPVDALTKERAAFNLVWVDETIGGQRVTPGLVADYFRRQSDDLRKELDGVYGDKAQRDQLKYWDAQEKYFRKLDTVEIDDAVMARLRAAARPFGDQNDRIMAATLGKSVAEIKRANYIRLLVIDPEFEVRAIARKRQANLEPIQLRIAQRNIRRLSDSVLELGSESGWGKAGKARSRKRFGEVREQLVGELRQARRLADSLDDQELVRVFDDALERLALARSEAMARSSGVADALAAIDRLDLSDEQIAGLAPEARAAYEQARAAEAEVARLASERETALREAGLQRSNVVAVRAAERRVQEALQTLQSRESMPRPDVESVADARRRLDEAEARLERVSRAQELKEPLRDAELSRDQKVAEAKRIINSGETVLDRLEVKVALDVTRTLAAVRIRGRKDFDYYTIERARNETLDEFIARVEAQDKAPVLHLVQTRAMRELGDAVMSFERTRLRTDPLARVRGGRKIESEGYTFMRGYEDPNMWRNLMFDTSELISSADWASRMTNFLNAHCLVFRFKPETLAEAKRLVDEGLVVVNKRDAEDNISAESVALAQVIRTKSIEVDMNDFVVIPVLAPSARRPSTRIDEGAIRMMEPESLADLTIRQITEREIDPDAPGDYYLVPRATYRAIMDTVNDEAFRIRPGRTRLGKAVYGADKLTRAWRTFTLNVFPRTAVVNITGSAILALQAGAGPRAMQYAAMAIMGIPLKMPDGSLRKLPVPPELRQRYYEQQLTDPVTAARLRIGEVPDPDAKDAAIAWVAWYMNSIRHLNGMSEDLGRLAIWYHKAYPEAMASAGQGPRFMASMKSLNDGAIDLLEAMARGDAEWRSKHEAWMRQSFDFLGDLHKGGRTASALRIAIPFWQWYTHMLTLTLYTMPMKYPGRALFLQQLGAIGAEYQERYGVMVPWGWGFIPFMTYDESLGIDVQKIIGGYDVGYVYPQYTFGQYATREGDVRALKSVYDATNPLISNLGFIFASAAAGQALEFDDKKLSRAVRDEFGIEIKGPGDSQFWNYIANRLFRMMPLSPSIMSMAGRAATSFPFPGQMNDRYVAVDDLIRADPNADRVDLTSLDNKPVNVFRFLQKILVGISYSEMEGLGPFAEKRWIDTAKRLARAKTDDERRIARSIEQALYEDADVSTRTPGFTP